MKKASVFFNFSKKITFLFLSAATFIFSACSAISDDAYVFTKNTDYIQINLDLDSSSRVYANDEPLRTITAPEIDLSSSTYNYYIWGKSSKATVNPQKVEFTSASATSGTIPLDFPISTYYFTLVATDQVPEDLSDSSKILKKAVLVAYTDVDLSYTTTVQFYLSTVGLKNYGDMNLSFVLDDTWSDAEVADLNSNYNVTVGLFETDTGYAVASFPSAAGLFGLSKSSPISLDTYSAISGTYDIIVSIKRNADAKIYTYKDSIIVAPNRVITASIPVPNVIEYLPKAPSDFKAAYCLDERIYYGTVTNSDGSSVVGDIDSSVTNEYALLLSWKDNSNNENNFKVTLAAISKMTPMPDIPSVVTDSVWASLVNPYAGNSSVVKVYDENCIYDETYFAGSLGKNNESLILYIPFGQCFIAKIEAVNSAGISSACYASLDTNFTINVYDENYGNNTAVYTGKAFSTAENPCNVINLYKVVYHLSGGTLEYMKDSVLKTNTGPIVDYGIYGSYSFLCPITDLENASESSPALLYLYSEDDAIAPYGSRWTYWKASSYFGENLINTSVGGSTVTVDENYSYQKPNAYTGYKSLYLFARYD